MSDFLEDPSVLTKDRLKGALLANNVALPNGDQRKDVYVQLYLKNLTAQNKKSTESPDVFSSDEELPPAPVVSNKSRSGRKATRKTDKVRPEETNVTELTDEGLKDLLLKYGLNVGPIVASTRKVYEKRLQKLLDQGPPEAAAPPSEASQTDGSQNGNTDSDQYSDKEEELIAPAPILVLEPEPEVEPEPVPVVERPIRSRGKTPVTTRTRSAQHNKENSEVSSAEFLPDTKDRRRTGPVMAGKDTRPLLTDKTSKLSSKAGSVKRRSAPVRSYHRGLNDAPPVDKDFSDVSVVKGVCVPLVRVKAHTLLDENSSDITSPPIRPSNREPFASLLNTACVEVDDHGMKDMLRCKYTCRSPLASSQETKSVTVPKLSKNIQPHLSRNETSKSLIEPMRRLSSAYECQTEDFPSSPLSFRDSASRLASDDSLLAVSVNLSQESCGSPETQPKKKQSKITPFLSPITPVRGLDSIHTETKQTAMVEKVSAIDQTPRTVERDVLKDIFPNENLSTPTGISATCRRPIRGAAGRPLGDTWLDETRLRHTPLRETSTSYIETRSVSRAAAVPLSASRPVPPPAVKTSARRGLPVWQQFLLLSLVAGFLFFVYQAMETNEVGLFKQSGSDSTSK
ncbi:thymopoietin a isoform X3 [Triplophysa dalaica]|uniref:thymopoietin a isoform X3 n=1 Tax=Triplophysa dalaica TaxID=1582913 RepID=UPI0024DF490C|nr:thymopoietin a isoform X3 [Triplophysa dalaica]